MRPATMHLAIPFLAIAMALGATNPHAQPQSSADIAFTNVSVLPMDRDAVLRDQTVVVRAGRIEEVGSANSVKPPAGAVVVDGRGKFLIPALAEMHAHIPAGQATDADIERTLLLYAANGLGTIRGMLGDPRHLKFRERVAKGEVLSPRIYTSGPALNGKSVPTVEAGRAAVREQKAAGYDLLKIHPGVRRDVFDAIDATADEVGITFGGHVPLEVGLQRALEAKYRSIEHMDGYIEALVKDGSQSQYFGINLVNDVDESKIGGLVARTRESGVWIVPTQILFENVLGETDADAMAQWPEMKYALPGQVADWIAAKKGMQSKIPAADRQKFLALRRRLLKTLFDAGVPVALGSDAPQIWNVPGFSTHRELKAMVSAGLTPFQALQTGTVKIARYFDTAATTGSVAKGKRADLVLLDANPLDDIGNTSRIAGVMLNGTWLPKAELDKKLGG